MRAVLEARESSAKYLAQVQPALVQQFDLMATAPGGVARVRELILTLAVQGKLVQQDPRDEESSSLVLQIRAEKEQLIAAKVLKREKDEPALTGNILPFEIPQTWTWVALGQVVDIVRGITFPASQKTKEAAPGRIACLRTSNVQRDIEWDDLLFVDRSFMGREDQLIQHHDIVMSMANSRELVGKVALIESIPHAEATFGGFLGVLRPRKIDPRYAMVVLRTPYARSLLIDSSSQTTNIANVSLAKLRPMPFPLPSEAEQARIVARVEELMHLCDALETQGQLETAQHVQLVSTLLGTLTDSANAEELAVNWQRAATHLDTLLDRPEAIDALEQTILQLAVRGLLVPQDPNDEPASVLLQRARIKKERPLAKSSNKHDELISAIKKAEQPFALPGGWEWVRMGNLIEGGSGTTPLRARTDYFAAGSEMWVKTTDLNNGVVTSCEELITKAAVSENRLKYFPAGTVCVAMYGGAGTIGKSGVLGVASTINQSVFALPPAEGIDSDFLHTYVISARSKWMSFAAGLRKDPNINGQIIKRMVMPLPPLTEQRRIVARVESLRRLCTELRQRLAARQSTQAHLAEALIDQVA